MSQLVYLFNPLDQGVLVEGHSLSTLMQMVLVSDAELQDLISIQSFQANAAGGRLTTQHSCKERRANDLNAGTQQLNTC